MLKLVTPKVHGQACFVPRNTLSICFNMLSNEFDANKVISRRKVGLSILVSNIAKETNASFSLRDTNEVDITFSKQFFLQSINVFS